MSRALHYFSWIVVTCVLATLLAQGRVYEVVTLVALVAFWHLLWPSEGSR